MGPNVGILLSAHEKFKSDYKTSFNKNEDFKDKLSTYNISFDFGIGFEYQIIERLTICSIFKYSTGLINQIKDNSVKATQKSKDLKVLIGPSFAF